MAESRPSSDPDPAASPAGSGRGNRTRGAELQQPIPLRQFWGPRYWLIWGGVGLMWLLAQLPFALQMRLGQGLGLLAYVFARQRRHICEVNLRLCFPDLSDRARQQLVRRNFSATGMGWLELVMAWGRPVELSRARLQVSGLEQLDRAQAQGRGVLLVGGHFTAMELAGSLLALLRPLDVTYRPLRNPLKNALMCNRRQRRFGRVIARGDVRAAIRSLKSGRILWYAPDQDYGPKHSVYVPFFGVPAATITATSRFARSNNSPVVFFSYYRKADNSGYHLHFSPPLPNYPSGDDTRDARRFNELVEQAVRRHPDQYLWIHKRFKTQPGGKAARPY